MSGLLDHIWTKKRVEYRAAEGSWMNEEGQGNRFVVDLLFDSRQTRGQFARYLHCRYDQRMRLSPTTNIAEAALTP